MPRKAWVQLNRLRTGHARFKANLHRMGLADNKNCVCGDIQPTVTSSATVLLWPLHAVSPTRPSKIRLNVFTILPFRLNRIVLPAVSYVHTTEEGEYFNLGGLEFFGV